MKKINEMVRSSYGELKNPRSLTGLSMLLALSILLAYFFRIDIGPQLSIGLSFIATALMGMLYGPVAAGLANGLGDLIKFVIKPQGGAYFIGFTFNVVLAGAIYGFLLYKRKPTLLRAATAKTLVNLVVNAFLNTMWMSLLYGQGFQAMIIPRIVKNITLLPLEIALLYTVLTASYRALSRAGYIKNQP